MRNAMIKAVIFDAYGTLINTGDGSVQASERIIKKSGRNINAREFYSKWKAYHRKHIDSLDAFIKEEEIFLIDLKELYKEYNIVGNAEEDVKIMLSTLGVRTIFPDTLEVLDNLRLKYKLYIGSTSDEIPLLSDIKRNGIVMDGYYTSEALGVYKPKKEFFLKILSKIEMQQDEVLFVGDSLIDDVLGPASVGITTVWINRKKQSLLPLDFKVFKPDYGISNLYELFNILTA